MKSRRLRCLASVLPALCLVLSLAGCSQGDDLPLLTSSPNGDYRLGAGDQLRLIVFGQPQLTGTFFIDASGAVSIPLVGDVHAAGLNRMQLANALVATLRERRLLVTPSVSIDIVQYRPIFVLGEVTKPGQYPYQPGLTMLSAVALAGGFTYRGVTSMAAVVRTDNGPTQIGRVTPETMLEPGDVVTIYERFF